MKKIFFIVFAFNSLQAQITTEIDTVSANEGDGVLMFVEEQPSFPGGEAAFSKFLDKNLEYPKEARKNKIEGTVWLSFIIDKEGKISNVTVQRGIGGGCDEEAKRVIEMMPPWIPGKANGKPVKLKYNFPIKFSLR